MNIDELYQTIILDHYREKHHSGLRDGYDAEVHHVNPSCGDEIMLRVALRIRFSRATSDSSPSSRRSACT